MDTQTCAASIQVYYGSKAEEINKISIHTVAPIDLQLTRTNDPIFSLRAKGSQQLSSKIVF